MSFSKYHMAYAALMHDIGKFVQRTGAADLDKVLFTAKCRFDDVNKRLTYKHAMWTTEFLYRYSLPIEDWDSIMEVAGCHHNPSVFQQDNYRIYLDYLREGDICSSIWDREQPEDSLGKYRANKVPLYTIFTSAGLGSAPSRPASQQPAYRLNPLMPAGAYPSMDLPGDLTNDYKSLWKGFEAEFASMHERYRAICDKNPGEFVDKYFQQYINCAQALLEKYTWCIPANTTEEAPTSSLYHHSRNTSLIASTLYAAKIQEAGPGNIDQEGKRFMVVSCDLNGIQSYLFDLNPENSRRAAKLLRARSTQVKVVMDLLARRVIDDLDLTSQNMMFNVSGKWFILAPALPEYEQKLEKLRAEIEEDICQRYLGALSVNLDWSVRVALADLNKYHFLNTLDKCVESLATRKYLKFRDYLVEDGSWQTADFITQQETPYADNICQYCHRWPVSNQESDCCRHCGNDIELGRMLTASETDIFKIFKHPTAPALVRLGEYGLFHAEKDELLDPYPATDYFYIKPGDGRNYPLPVKPYSAAVPMGRDGTALEFGEIADKAASGLKALSVIKGDVDDLGLIFWKGLWRKDGSGSLVCSISEYATFSSMVDYFFAQMIPHKIRDNYPDTVYTVYSGGDDFCLVGAWQDNIRLGKELAGMFQEYCAGNPELHFSAAIAMLHPKAPLRFVIEEAESHLKTAKDLGRDRFYLFETYIPTADLGKQLDLADKLDTLLKDPSEDTRGVTKQLLYRLLGYQSMYENSTLTDRVTHDNLYDALLHYDIRRNIMRCDRHGRVSNEEVVNLFKSFTDLSGNASIRYLRVPVCHTLYKNRDKMEV